MDAVKKGEIGRSHRKYQKDQKNWYFTTKNKKTGSYSEELAIRNEKAT